MPKGQEIVERIKSGPHWRLLIRPLPFIGDRVPYEELLPTMARAKVQFRGWDFPHINRQEPVLRGTDWIASADDFRGHIEYWRFYTSGQFIYLGSVREATDPDWKAKLAQTARFGLLVASDEFDWSQVPGFFDVVNFVYVLTEFFE